MAECCDTRIEPETVGEHLFHVFCADGVQFCVMRTFCDDDDRLAFPDCAVLEVVYKSIRVLGC